MGTSLSGAIDKWRKFAYGDQLPPGFTCVGSGFEKGILKYANCAIHADYDLMFINNADKSGNMIFTSTEDQNVLYFHVHRHLNMRLGTPLIQHGPEFAWEGGVGAADRELVLYFGPGRKYDQATSSMSKKKGMMI